MLIFSAIVGLAALFMAGFLFALCWEDHYGKRGRLANASGSHGRGYWGRQCSVFKVTQPLPRRPNSRAATRVVVIETISNRCLEQ